MTTLMNIFVATIMIIYYSFNNNFGLTFLCVCKLSAILPSVIRSLLLYDVPLRPGRRTRLQYVIRVLAARRCHAAMTVRMRRP